MSQSNLKKTLLATIDSIKENPQTSKIVFRAETHLKDDVCCSAKVRDFPELIIDEPAPLGGSDQGMNPVELIAVSLGTCQEIMYAAYASVMDIKLDSLSVDVKGNLDLKGLFGIDENVPSGYSEIKYITNIKSEAPAEMIQQLVQTVESHCPALDTLTRPVNVSGTVFHNETRVQTDQAA